MSYMNRATFILATILAIGCYDFENGSSAKVLDAKGVVVANDDPQREPVFWDDCVPQDEDGSFESFDFMKSGDSCKALCEDDESEVCAPDFGCGTSGPNDFDDARFGRWAYCLDGIVSITDKAALDEASPRSDVVWSDCGNAMADGRTGETCVGVFSCYTALANHCIEKVTCGEAENAEPLCNEQLARYMMCDDALTAVNTSTESVVTNCTEAATATAGAPCQGAFVCEGVRYGQRYELHPVAPCANGVGYCRDGETAYDVAQLVWCDNQKIRIFENMNVGIQYLPQTDCDPYDNNDSIASSDDASQK